MRAESNIEQVFRNVFTKDGIGHLFAQSDDVNFTFEEILT